MLHNVKWMQDAVDHRLETSMKTRVLLRRYFRDKDFDYNMAESDLNYLSRVQKRWKNIGICNGGNIIVKRWPAESRNVH